MFDKQEALNRVIEKLKRTSARIGDEIPYQSKGGKYDDYSDKIHWWTNGFWPGILWLAYRKTRDEAFANFARKVEEKLDACLAEYYELHHDVGFMWHISAVANYKMTGNKDSARRGYLAACSLAARYNPAGNFIRAWNGTQNGKPVTGWAIIDCMMNLPLLYWASDFMEDPRFANIAKLHAETVMKHFIYPDGSSKHICSFDPATGEYIENFGGQGYSANSAWSRGAAWALYGFALSAKYTNRQDFLDTAKRVANFFLAHLPSDFVPFSDFKAPADVNVHKDSSAAAIAASGLLLLAKLLDEAEGACYHSAAVNIIQSLYENYTDWDGDEALIQKGCVAFHIHEQESTLIYGDYYFLEALMQLCGFDELF